METYEKVFLTIFFSLLVLLCCFEFTASYKQAEIYNEINGTDFTWSDFLFAGNQINQQTQTINID